MFSFNQSGRPLAIDFLNNEIQTKYDLFSLSQKVQQLQGSMRGILECMTVLCNSQDIQQKTQLPIAQTNQTTSDVKDSSATQTEIVAVHTPQVENLPFPFLNKLQRPSTLPLGDSNDSGNRKGEKTQTEVTKQKIDEIEERKENTLGHDDSLVKNATKELISKSSRDETPENMEKDEDNTNNKAQSTSTDAAAVSDVIAKN